MSDVTEILTDYSKDVKAVIEDYLSNIDPEDLQKSSVYLTEAGGKMLRPALTLLSSQAVGGNREDALKTAAAFEMIHTFSLIHDDIIAESLAVVADACVKICEGQALDMGFEGNFDVQEEEYMEMIFKKTAALIAGACKAGAIVGGADSEVIDAMYEYGRLIGLAFQIQDDYLDVISDEKDLGKPVGSDIVEGKMTLMVVKALSEANEEDKEKLVKILSDPESPQEDVDIAIDLFNKYGSIEYAHDVALSNVNKAKEILNILPNSSSKDALALLADFVIERKS